MWLLPTLNRIDKLKHLLKSMEDTYTSTPGLIITDKSDYALNEKDYKEIESKFLPKDWRIELTEAVSMGDKCREIWPKVKDCKYVGILNDDHEMVMPNWDKILIHRLDGKNFVSANDRTVNAFRLPVTATAWSMPLLECVGWPIYPPNLQHLFIDNLWRDLGKATGCWRVVASAIVLHNHVIFGKATEDETHRKVYNKESWTKDETWYVEFMKTDFQKTVEKIKAFQNLVPGEAWNPEAQKRIEYERLAIP